MKNHAQSDAYTDEVILSAIDSPLSIDPTAIPVPELQGSFRRLALLFRLGHQICAETDEARVFETILSSTAKMLRVERAFVTTYSQGKLVPRATYQIDLAGEASTWPVSSTMLRRVLDQGISLLTTDALHDAQYKKASSVDLHNIRSVMCCPLGGRQDPKGLIYVDNRVHTNAFSRPDLEFLSALAHYARLAIQNAADRRTIAAEKDLAEARLEALRNEVATQSDIVGVSPEIIQCYGQVKKLARKEISILIVGETGTGKEVFARAIHSSSPRASGPFIAVNVRGLPATLVESELFGHEKGAFTGADKRRMGRFELAQGGTLFLDEVLDIPMDVQPKLLRVLEQREFERLGGNNVVRADVRIVCACNKDPVQAVAQGLFREDLFYRLNGIILPLPPLRERGADIIPLIHHFLRQCGSDKVFDEDALASLSAYPWLGNIRELKHCVEALDALVEGKRIRKSDLPPRMQQSSSRIDAFSGFESLSSLVARIEKEHILEAIEISRGNNERAIQLLKISRAKFFERKKEYGI